MARPKNEVTLTPRNKERTIYDIWYRNEQGEKVMIQASTTTILRGVQAIKKGLILDK